MEFVKKNISLWTFFLCASLVFFIHFVLYQPVIQYRLFNVTEDWPFLVLYRSLIPNPLVRLPDIWTSAGLHTTAQIYYIGILSDFLIFNYQGYQIVNVILKTLATLSLFPLVLIIFRNRLLAYLSTILFGISSATAGSFRWIVKGSEYLAVAMMNIFLIVYYFTIKRNSKRLLILSSILLLITYLLAPPRLFPLLLLVPVIEVYWLLKMGILANFKQSIFRAVILILPVVLISMTAPVSSCCPFTSRPLILFRDILNGNWHNLLDPFAGIGWSLLTNDVLKFFGNLEYETFKSFESYLEFIFKGPVLIFASATLILSRILSKKPWKFFVTVFVFNLLSEMLLFFIANNHFNIPKSQVAELSKGQFVTTKFPTLVAIYIFIVAFMSFMNWMKDKKNKLVLALWVGPTFSVIFLWPTWIIMGPLVNDLTSVHWYFMIPAMGIALFSGAILVLLYERLRFSKLSKAFAILTIIGIISTLSYTHALAIKKDYLGMNPLKLKITDQQALHEKLISKLTDSTKSGDLLIYFDIPGNDADLRITPQYYKEALVMTIFGNWFHFRRGGDGRINDGCIDAIVDREILKSAIVLEKEKGFRHKGYCIYREKSSYGSDKIFYNMDEFYAFRVKDGQFIDIKKEILKELGIH